MICMKKVKLRKWVICFISILFICIISCFFIFGNNNDKIIVNDEDKNINYMQLLLELNNNVYDEKFLFWISEKFGDDVIIKIYNSMKENNFDISDWYNLTGNSYIVLQDLYNDIYTNNDRVTYVEGKKDFISIGFAGDVSLADNWAIMPKYNSRGKGINGILSENMVDYISKLDWMTINSEFAFSSRGSAMRGKQYTFRANPNNVNVYHEMGVDMVTLANNHVYDYGMNAFYDTLSTLKTSKIPYIGASANKNEAEDAYYLVINGYKISFLNATRAEKYILTPEATDDNPGVFRCYDPTRLSERIKEEKEKSDYVVVIVHWGKETYHTLENVQIETGKIYIDSGADMVIGHHAHVLQGVEFYKGKLIAYNLGNFIFNSLSVDTGILKWELSNNGESKFYFYPGLQSDCYTRDVVGVDAINLYDKMTNWSINAKFLENGEIVEVTN